MNNKIREGYPFVHQEKKIQTKNECIGWLPWRLRITRSQPSQTHVDYVDRNKAKRNISIVVRWVTLEENSEKALGIKCVVKNNKRLQMADEFAQRQRHFFAFYLIKKLHLLVNKLKQPSQQIINKADFITTLSVRCLKLFSSLCILVSVYSWFSNKIIDKQGAGRIQSKGNPKRKAKNQIQAIRRKFISFFLSYRSSQQLKNIG